VLSSRVRIVAGSGIASIIFATRILSSLISRPLSVNKAAVSGMEHTALLSHPTVDPHTVAVVVVGRRQSLLGLTRAAAILEWAIRVRACHSRAILGTASLSRDTVDLLRRHRLTREVRLRLSRISLRIRLTPARLMTPPEWRRPTSSNRSPSYSRAWAERPVESVHLLLGLESQASAKAGTLRRLNSSIHNSMRRAGSSRSSNRRSRRLSAEVRF